MTISLEEQSANRAKLVEALRSGNYKQGIGYLKVNNKNEDLFCCLGVACDLIKGYKWEIRDVHRNFDGFQESKSYYIIYDINGLYTNNVMPKIMLKYYGFDTVGGSFDVEKYRIFEKS